MSVDEALNFKPVAEMTKQEIVAEIGRLESELSLDEATYRQWETIASKGGSSSSGCAAILLGVILTFLIPIIGIPLIIIGIVVGLTSSNPDRKKALQQMQIGQPQIAAKRGRLAELKAHSTIIAQPSTLSQVSVDERLAKLADLKTRGLIDETEYNAKRQQILNDL